MKGPPIEASKQPPNPNHGRAFKCFGVCLPSGGAQVSVTLASEESTTCGDLISSSNQALTHDKWTSVAHSWPWMMDFRTSLESPRGGYEERAKPLMCCSVHSSQRYPFLAVAHMVPKFFGPHFHHPSLSPPGHRARSGTPRRGYICPA